MKKIILILLSSLFLAACSKDPIFMDSQGQPIQLSKLKGKWVVVNYWAEWCHSCLKEIPELNHFNAANQHKNIILLGVNYDNLQPDDLKKALHTTHITFPVLTQNPSQAWHLGDLSIVPVTFILNPEGHVVKTIAGSTTEKILTQTLQSLQINAHA